jgi:carboxyl-terminal processing protease
MLVEVSPSDGDPKPEPQELRVRVGEAVHTSSLQRVTDLYEMNWKLIDVFRFVADRLPDDVSPNDVEYATINGMLRTLDPHSILLSPEAYEEMQMSTGGKFGGIGIQIVQREGVLQITGVLPETPASAAGLAKGDRILQIDEESTLNMSLTDAVQRLRGDAGTSVVVLIARESWPEPRAVPLVRADIKIKSVEHRALDGGIGYARVKSFQTGTSAELRRALEDLRAKESLRGLVLDLRDNPGGLLDEAVKLSDLFLSTGTIVVTVAGGDKTREEKHASGHAPYPDLPLAVLVNSSSASASEIVTGALKNNNRAVVVGSTTFGKGSVQVPFEIDDAALKLTVAQYLTPGDLSIQNTGVAPDIGLRTVRLEKDRVVLYGPDPDARGEKDLPSHLVGDKTAQADQPNATLRILAPLPPKPKDRKANDTPAEKLEAVSELREAEDALAEEPVRLTARILSAAPAGRRSTLLANARAVLQDLRRADDEAIERRAAELGIDWHAGVATRPAQGVRLELVGGDKGGIVSGAAGETLKLNVRVHNLSGARQQRLHLLTSSEFGPARDREALIGRLEDGEARTVALTLKLPKEAFSRRVPLSVALHQDGSAVGSTLDLDLEVRGAERPRWALGVALQDGDASHPADGRVQIGETVKLSVKLRNVGPGASNATVATLRNASGEAIFLREGRANIPALAVGQEASATFELALRKAPRRGAPRVELSVFDTTLHALRSQELRLPWEGDAPDARPDPLLVAGALDEPPRVDLPDVLARGLITTDETVTISGTATFHADDAPRRFVVLYRNGTKVAYVGADGRSELPFSTVVRLDKGANTVTIQARTGVDEVSERSVVVFRR